MNSNKNLIKTKKRVVLIILDGFGLSKQKKGNAVYLAKPEYYNNLIKTRTHSSLKVSGQAVGLPKGNQGTSEVGHLHFGAGKIVWQPLELINRKIEDKSFFKNKELLKAVSRAKQFKTSLHLMGLCSDEGVHSHINHLKPLLLMAKKHGMKKVFIHFIADGRDVPEKTAKKYVRLIQSWTKKHGVGKIASIAGRFYAMDRDNNWHRTQKAFELLTEGKGFKETNPLNAVENAYKRGDKTDYYLRPIVLTDKQWVPLTTIKNNDSVIFFNFRTDRARQLTKAFTSKKFSFFKRNFSPKTLFVCFTQYNKTIKAPVAFPQEKVSHNLARVLSEHGLRQLRVAETEKYAHVTYFFNSQIEKPFPKEERIMVASPKVPSYDLTPEMNASGITKTSLKEIKKNKFDFILINFANPDLVGHSGNLKAVIKAVKTVDKFISKLIPVCLKNNYSVLLTADHGNAEFMVLSNGKHNPSHTKNKVPFILISNEPSLRKARLKNGEAIDVAPTILQLLGIKKPKEMTGKSLIFL